MVSRFIRLAALILFLATQALAQDAAKPVFYDEIRDPTGAIRPQYQEIWRIYQSMSEAEKAAFSQKSVKMFLGDLALDALPRVLTELEFLTLQAGVEQRGEALRIFLKDYYGGTGMWKSVIPEPVLSRVVERSGESHFLGRINPHRISFPYGPDIIRDAQGKWRVLEDNTGNIGGPGDIAKGREILTKLVPQYKKAAGFVDEPTRYFKKLVERYRQTVAGQNGVLVLYTLPLSEQSDKEDVRFRNLMREQGVLVISPSMKDRRLKVYDDGVYVQRREQGAWVKRERVSFVIMNADHKDLDYRTREYEKLAYLEELESHIESYELMLNYRDPNKSLSALEPIDRSIVRFGRAKPYAELQRKLDLLLLARKSVQESAGVEKTVFTSVREALALSDFSDEIASALRKRSSGVVDAIIEGKVATNYVPGLDFVGDKEFNAYVDGLVKLYLKEEPILTSVPSRPFAQFKNGRWVLDQKLVDEVFANKDRFVVKVVDGRGGDGIWGGPKVSAEEFEKAREALLKEPWRYRAQDYTHLSVLADRIVDLRLISYVDREGVLVCETPWGRAISMHGDGKVNISSNGMESPVVVVKTPPGTSTADCDKLLLPRGAQP